MALQVHNLGLNSYDLKYYNFLVMFDSTDIDLWIDSTQIDVSTLDDVDYEFLNNWIQKQQYK